MSRVAMPGPVNVGGVAKVSPLMEAIGQLDASIARLITLSETIHDRVLGQHPEDVPNQKGAPTRGGLLGSLDLMLAGVQAATNKLNEVNEIL